MRTPLVAGNWKMNGNLDSVTTLLQGLLDGADSVTNAELAVFPPYVFLPLCAELLKASSIAYGAQNVCDQASGAYTAEVSADMLLELGCQYAIVGHSERRQLYKETNELVAARFFQALNSGLTPILCVGETLEEREAGKTWAVVKEQLAAVLTMQDNSPSLNRMVIAYEPVWAIGTGVTASPEQAQEVHAQIRAELASHSAELADSVRVLYGGSVKPGNAAELFAQKDIDGALVGGASLQAESFLEIGKACKK